MKEKGLSISSSCSSQIAMHRIAMHRIAMQRIAMKTPGIKWLIAGFLALSLSITGEVALAQQSIIRGTVVAAIDGESLQGVNIALYEADSLRLGTVSGNDGVYALAKIQAGTYELRASFIGFESFVDTLVIGRADRIIINLTLEIEQTTLDELVVEGDREAGTARVLAGQTTIRPADIEMIPGPDISGDLVNYLTTLPGIVSVCDRGGQLFIRGGEPWQNLVQRVDSSGSSLCLPVRLRTRLGSRRRFVVGRVRIWKQSLKCRDRHERQHDDSS